MPLPAGGGSWPPAHLDAITPRIAEWSAWYSGDPQALRETYTNTAANRTRNRPSQYAGGVVGAVARMWWGRPVHDLTKRQDQLHVPIAADLCQASADLLFSEPPTLTVDDTATQDELAEFVDDTLLTTLAEAAEIGAALTGAYLRVTWDRALVADRCFATVVSADHAVPEFRFGRLVAVTFWWIVERDGQRVIRHLERHELAGDGTGIILHGLYDGTDDDLGRLVPLTEHRDTASLPVNDEATISTGSPGLGVVYVPNQRPQRRWRDDPVGANLGRSDLDGVEGLMDSLDETYSSWMRDVRLAKGRIIVPSYMLTSQGPGRGAIFDQDQEVFAPVNAPPRDDGRTDITPQQFAIRVEEHARTADELVQTILRTAGYSAQTFGESTDTAATATEVTARERRSYMTRDRKIRLWRPALGAFIAKLLATNAAQFSKPGNPEGLSVDFGDAVQADPEALARTALALRQAEAASTRTLVQIVHPDWDDQALDNEVALIRGEAPVTDPDLIGPFAGGQRRPGDTGTDDPPDA